MKPRPEFDGKTHVDAWVTSLTDVGGGRENGDRAAEAVETSTSSPPTRVGLQPLSTKVFGLPPRTDILRRVVTYQRARWRGTSTAATKTRGEVRGGGKKPWPQKGTGRARHGSRRSPIFVGGGTVHGPQPRDYTQSLPRKVRALGLRVALSIKYAQGDLHIVDNYELPTQKTSNFVRICQAHGWESALLVLPQPLPVNLTWAARNLPRIQTISVNSINVYDILHREALVLTPEVVALLEARFDAQSLPPYLINQEGLDEEGGAGGAAKVDTAAAEAATL